MALMKTRTGLIVAGVAVTAVIGLQVMDSNDHDLAGGECVSLFGQEENADGSSEYGFKNVACGTPGSRVVKIVVQGQAPCPAGTEGFTIVRSGEQEGEETYCLNP